MTEDTLDATHTFVKAVCHDHPVSKRGYLKVVLAVSDKFQKTQPESKATTRHLTVPKVKV